MTLREAILLTLKTGEVCSRQALRNCCALAGPFRPSDRALRAEIAAIVCEGVAPIMSLSTGGYRLAETQAEIDAERAKLASYIADLEKRREGLRMCASQTRPLFGDGGAKR